MLCNSPGLLPGSEFFFATPSTQARSLFYYVLAAGSYCCTKGYLVRRDRYDSILLIEIQEGSCTIECGGKTYHAHHGDVVLLNCYRPHTYFATGHLKMRWLHFDGGQSTSFAETLEKAQGVVFPCEVPDLLSETLDRILAILRTEQPLSEPTVSCLIHTLLCSMIASSAGSMEPETSAIAEAIRYMRSHCGERLTVSQIAQFVSISPSHFSRLFKRETGSSPYEYLMNLRLDNAKSLLKKTQLSVAEIAEQTGFASQSNFIYAFHDRVGLSPARFRAMRF